MLARAFGFLHGLFRFGFAADGFEALLIQFLLIVFELLFRFQQRLNFVPQPVGFVDQLLGLLAVVPKGFPRHQGIQLTQAFLRTRDVKETSADEPVSPPPSKFLP